MATWETTSTSTSWANGALTTGNPVINSITDNKNDGATAETTFEKDETLTAKAGANEVTVTFLGTLTVGGVKYPVVALGNTWWAVGLDRSTPGVPTTLTRSNLDESDFTVCFLPGTLVATPSGERKVEELAAGDMVLTESGRTVPAKWIGRQTVSTRFGPADRLMPVRFAAGSLGGGGGDPLVPHSDLTITADHALLLDGVLCQASALVNGTTITRVPLSEFGNTYAVYHVETEAHEILLANGAPSESFVDNVTRRAFDNHTEFKALFGEHPPEMKELPHPRAANARQLPARIKIRLGIDGMEADKVA